MTTPDVEAYPFTFAVQATADANGNATVQAGPSKANEDWTVTSQHVTNPGPRVPEVLTYKDFVAQAGFLEGTTRGTQDNSDTSIDLLTGQILIWVWSGCSVGTVCGVTIRGTRNIAV